MPDQPPTGPRPVIEVRHLRKAYASTPVLRDVSFAVARGETLCLLGPNGAGKTTTVEILEGFRRRDRGDVSILGLDPARGDGALKARLGIVHQSCGVHEELTPHELLTVFARYYPAPAAPRMLLEQVELGDHANARIGALSGGQRRRLDLALALVGQPELLILDEPTTGFDPEARRQAWTLVRTLCQGGMSVLLTTHMMDEAQALADRIVVLAGGEIIAEGTPHELGGRDRAPAEIRFSLPDGYHVGDLPRLTAADVRAEGSTIVVTTSEATGTTAKLLAWAEKRNADLRGFHVAQPSLEDTYLELIAQRKGRS